MSEDRTEAGLSTGLSRRDFLKGLGLGVGALFSAAGLKKIVEEFDRLGQHPPEDWKQFLKTEVFDLPDEESFQQTIRAKFGISSDKEVTTFGLKASGPTGEDSSEIAVVRQEATWPHNARMLLRNNAKLVELHPVTVFNERGRKAAIYSILPRDSDLQFFADSPIKFEGILTLDYKFDQNGQFKDPDTVNFSPPIKGLKKLREGKAIGGGIRFVYSDVPLTAKETLRPQTKI